MMQYHNDETCILILYVMDWSTTHKLHIYKDMTNRAGERGGGKWGYLPRASRNNWGLTVIELGDHTFSVASSCIIGLLQRPPPSPPPWPICMQVRDGMSQVLWGPKQSLTPGLTMALTGSDDKWIVMHLGYGWKPIKMVSEEFCGHTWIGNINYMSPHINEQCFANELCLPM